VINLIEIKKQLHLQCIDIVEKRIKGLKDALSETQNAANNETKSSAGDKHETGRAMAQLETEKLNHQLGEVLKLIQTLSTIDINQKLMNVALGSLIVTNRGRFYLSVSLGKISFQDHDYYVISPVSPIGKQLLTKKEKESFSFNGIKYVIEQVV